MWMKEYDGLANGMEGTVMSAVAVVGFSLERSRVERN
jgi:hypothetical protein